MRHSIASIGILGGGAWGSALAAAAARAGRDVVLWARDPETIDDINRSHENRRRLPGIPLEPSIRATATAAEAAACDALILAVPTQALRSVAQACGRHLRPGQPAIIAAKGLERDGGAFLSDVLTQLLPQAIPAVLSGPSFATDVGRGLPTAVTLACADPVIGGRLVDALGHAAFRPYRTDDMIGTQVGGAVKNVLAIACGIVKGRALGASAHAALIARGFAEMRRFGEALGGRPETLAGLSGLGDLVLTGTSRQSRNFSFGIALGCGGSVASVIDSAALTEGVWTAPAVVERARELGVEMPICAAVAAVVEGGLGLDDAIDGLLARPFRDEGS